MKRSPTSSTLTTERDRGRLSEPELQTQILTNPYISFEKLEELLKSKFGSNWKVQVGVLHWPKDDRFDSVSQVKLGRVILAVPELLENVS